MNFIIRQRISLTVLLVPVLFASPSEIIAQTSAPIRRDVAGDPLPVRALARLGTVRFTDLGEINAFAISPDGKIIAGSHSETRLGRSVTTTIGLWDNSGKRIHTSKLDEQVYWLKFSPDGRSLAAVGRKSVTVWDMSALRVMWSYETSVAPCALNFVDGNRIIMTRALSLDTPNGGVVVQKWWTALTTHSLKTKQKLDSWHFQVLEYSPPEGQSFSGCGAKVSANGRFVAARGHCGVWRSPKEGGSTAPVSEYHKILLLIADIKKRQILQTIDDFKEPIQHWELSPDGKFVVVVDQKRLWRIDVQSGKKKLLKSLASPCEHLQILADGKTAVSLHGAEVSIWRIGDGKERERFHIGSYCRCIATPDGKTLAVNYGTTVRLWDLRTGKEKRMTGGHKRTVHRLHFTADGKLVSQGMAGEWRVWDARSWKLRRSFYLPWQESGKDPIVAEDLENLRCVRRTKQGELQLYRLPENKYIRTLGKEQKKLSEKIYGFSADGHIFAFGGMQGNRFSVQFIDSMTGKKISDIDGRKDVADLPYNPLPFLKNGKRFALHSTGGRLALFDVASGKRIRIVGAPKNDPDHLWLFRPSRQQFSANGRLYFTYVTVAAPDTDDRAKAPLWIWDTTNGKVVQKLDLFAPTENKHGHIIAVALSPNNRLLFAANADDPDIHVWEVASGRLRGKLKGHLQAATAFAFSADGHYLASGSPDTTILIWDLCGPLQPGQAKRKQLSQKELTVAWQKLAHTEATEADSAIWTLIRHPRKSLPFLKEHLRPVQPVAEEKIKQWIAELDSGSFKIRTKATQHLEQLAELAIPALEKALKQNPTLEAHLRIEALLKKVRSLQPSPHRLQYLRALEVLERIGTREAQQHLQQLASGVPRARLTQQARECLGRLQS